MFPPPDPSGGAGAPNDDDAAMDEDAMLQAAIAASMETAAAEQQAAGGGGPAPMQATGGEEPAPPPSFSLAEETTAGAGAGAGGAGAGGAAAPALAASLAASLAAALGGTAAAAQQAPPAAAAAANGVDGQQLAAALAQAFHAAQQAAAAAASAAGGPYSVVAPPPAPQRRAQQQQPAPRPQQPARVLPPAPAWAEELAASAPPTAKASSSPSPPAWLLCGASPSSPSSSSLAAPVEVPESERAVVSAALSSALGSPPPAGGGGGEDAASLSRSFFDAAVRAASSPAASLARRASSSSSGGGGSGAPDPQVLVLAAIHDRAAAAATAAAASSPAAAAAAAAALERRPAAAALRALAAAAARAAVALLAGAGDADGDDLFFETVPSHEALASGLARGQVSAAFLDSCLAASAEAWEGGGGGGEEQEQQQGQHFSPPLLTRALASQAWHRALSAALHAVARARLSDLPDAWSLALAPLDAMTSRPQLAAALAAALAAEALAAAPRGGGAAAAGGSSFGASFERAAVLAPLLRVSPFPDVPASMSTRRVVSPARGVFESLRGYPERYGEAVTATRGLAAPLEAAARAAHGCAERAARAKIVLPSSSSAPPPPTTALPPTAPREALLAWIAAAADALSLRASGGDKGALEPGAVVGTASDAFALGLSALCLRLCRPFAPLSPGKDAAAAAAAASALGKVLPRLDPSYYGGAGLWRLPGVAEKSSPLCPALAAAARARGGGGKQGGGAAAAGGDDDMDDDGGDDDDDDDDPSSSSKKASAVAPAPLPFFPYFSPDPSSASSPHFVAECFFLTQRVLHVGLMPAINRFQEGWDHFSKLGQAQAQAAGDEARAAGPSLEESLFRDCGLAHLSEPSLVSDAVAFAALTATWLHSLLKTSTASSASSPPSSSAITSVPEYALRDACGLLSFILRCGGADVVGGADVGALVGALAALLGARVPTAAAASSSSSSTPAAAAATAPPLLSPLSAAACVELLQTMLAPQLDNGSGRRRNASSLGPAAMSPGERALVATVLSAGGRGGVSELVPALMRAHAGCDVVVGLDVDRDRFDKFGFRSQVDALLMELWNDASCLSATAALAAAAAAAASGSSSKDAVSSNEFGDYVGSVLNSLIYLLEDCINRLQAIQENEEQQRSGAWGSLPARERSKKEAYLRSEASVTRGFMRMALQALDVLGRLAGEPAIAASFAAPALAGKVAFAVVAFLNSVAGDRGAALRSIERPERFRYDPVRLQKAMVTIALRLRRAGQGGGASAAAAGGSGGTGDAGEALVRALAAEPDFVAESLRRAAAAAGATDYGARAGFEALVDEVVALRSGGGGGGGGGAASSALAASASSAGAAAAAAPTDLDLSLPEPQLSGPELEAAYSQALAPLSFGDFDASAPRAYSRAFAAAADGGGPLSRRAAKRIARELKELQQPGGLPLSPSASIFVRAASDRLDKARAVLSGPEGTPYFGGLFLFDVLFPARYPDVPPLLSLDTTGGGRARLNPNLYADGKVCLSLLGTWHGSDASEKWDADAANLWRVLVSVQGMILVADPYFNEPGVEAVRGTPEGDAASSRYNARLQLNVVRHAMNGMLDSPPPGFEGVVRRHFRLVGGKALEAAASAAKAAGEGSADAALAAQLRAEVEGLRERLVKLQQQQEKD